MAESLSSERIKPLAGIPFKSIIKYFAPCHCILKFDSFPPSALETVQISRNGIERHFQEDFEKDELQLWFCVITKWKFAGLENDSDQCS